MKIITVIICSIKNNHYLCHILIEPAATDKRHKIMKANVLDACNYVVAFGSVEMGKTVRYNDNNTVQVVSVLEPMLFTDNGANRVVDIYTSMGCTCVTKIKFVEWQRVNSK